jgi:4-amino-4-deoxy-L-arabinose transferase-like glycosyltransferase
MALIGGGGFLLLLAQLTARAVPGMQRPLVYLFALLGALLFILGGQAVMRQTVPLWLWRPSQWLARFLDIDGWQTVLLVLAPCLAWLAHLAAGDLLLARRFGIMLLAWLAACGFAVAAVLPGNRERARHWLPRLERGDMLLSLGLLVVAFALRGVATEQWPTTFSGDEGSAALSSLQFLNGQANNPFTVGWFSFPSLFFALQSIGILIAGQTISAVRLFSALGGALTVVALFWLGRIMFDRLTALLAAAYLTASHYHIHMSRVALNNIWDGLFGTIAIAGLWYGWKHNRRVGFVICGLALGLGQYFYIAIRVVPILFLIWAAVAWWQERERFGQRLAGLVVAAYLAAVLFLPLALYFAGHPDEFRAPLNRVSIVGDWLEHEMAASGRSAPRILLDQTVAGVLGFTHEPLRLLYNPGAPLLLTAAATFFLLGVMWGGLNFDLRYLLLLLPLGAAVASNTFSQDSPASQRYILAMPLVALWLAVPLAELSRWLRQLWPKARPLLVSGVVLVMTLLMLIDLRYYFLEVPDRYVLGGGNTQVATDIALYLRDHPQPGQDVYFFGFPRMGYFSLSTIPYLAPEMHGEDIIDPLTAAPTWTVDGPSIFIFLPERLNELTWVRERYPDGQYQTFLAPNGSMAFAAYEVEEGVIDN